MTADEEERRKLKKAAKKEARKEAKKEKKSSESTRKREKADDDDELDDLFAEARRKKKGKTTKEADDETKESSEVSGNVLRAKRDLPPDNDYGRIKSNIEIQVDARIINPEAPIHRWDKESGLPVYKAAALKAFTEESGGGPDCPFDCNCCF